MQLKFFKESSSREGAMGEERPQVAMLALVHWSQGFNI